MSAFMKGLTNPSLMEMFGSMTAFAVFVVVLGLIGLGLVRLAMRIHDPL